MDPFSWERRSDILSFEEKAKIRSALKRQLAFDDDYGASGDDHGFEYWFWQFRYIYRLRNKKNAGKHIDAIRRSQERRRVNRPEEDGPLQALLNALDEDD